MISKLMTQSSDAHRVNVSLVEYSISCSRMCQRRISISFLEFYMYVKCFFPYFLLSFLSNFSLILYVNPFLQFPCFVLFLDCDTFLIMFPSGRLFESNYKLRFNKGNPVAKRVVPLYAASVLAQTIAF